MSDCIFCKIVAGQIPAKKLYEDEHSVALLDAFPLVEGHTLVIPKVHYALLQDMPAEAAKVWFAAVQTVCGKLQAAMKAGATSPEAKIEAFRNAATYMSAIFLLGLLVLPFLPETKGKPLPED